MAEADENIVLRLFDIPLSDATKLNPLSLHFGVYESDLMHTAVHLKLAAWEADESRELVHKEVELGKPTPNERTLLRSMYLRGSDDEKLKELASTQNFLKAELLRAAINLKLKEWEADESNELVHREVELARQALGGFGP